MSEPAAVATLVTARLELRPVTAADAPACQRHFADYEVIRHLSARVPWPYPEDGARTYIRDVVLPAQGRDHWVWGLHRRDGGDGGLVGIIDLWRKQDRPTNRGFWLGRAFWGRGYMTEAVVRVTDHAFDDLGFDVLVFGNAEGNDRSHAIKRKTGARLVAVVPATFVDPAYARMELWRLTRTDWERWRRANTAAAASPGRLDD